MAFKLLLFDGTAGYEVPCADGSLQELANVQAGTVTDQNGHSWTIQKGLTNGNQYITMSCSGSFGIELDQMPDTLEYLGIGLNHAYINLYEVFGLCDLHLKLEDQEGNYPQYRIEITRASDAGQIRNRINYKWYFETQNIGSEAGNYSEYNTTGSYTQEVYAAPLLLAGSEEDKYIFGSWAMVFARDTNYTNIAIRFEWNTAINTDTWAELSYSAGEKGFKPTAARTTKNIAGIGGGRSKVPPGYISYLIQQPGEPDETQASASGSKFITAYDITPANLEGVGACLWGTTLLGKLSGIFVNPLDYIVSLAIFPYKPHIGSSQPIKFGAYYCTNDLTDPQALGTNAYGNKLSKQYRTVDFGTVSIAENWESFLDYEHTEIELYLPFIGTVSLDPNECMGGTVNVQYTIDFYTGMCVANVLCTKPLILPSGQSLHNVAAQHSYQGNCAAQIPLSRTDYGAMVGNLINACTQAITDPAKGAITLATDAITGGLRPNVTSKGNIVANSGYCSVLYPYVRITRPITAEPESYQEVMGYPSYINTSLGECEGLCICDDIDLKNVNGATDEELNRIKQLCREGVYI